MVSNKKKNIIFCSTEFVTSSDYGGLAIFLDKFLKNLKKNYNVHLIVTSKNDNIRKYKGIFIYNVNIDKLYLKIFKKYLLPLFFIFQSFLINKKINQLINTIKNISFVHFSNYQCLSLFYNNKLPSITRLSSLETLWSKKDFFSFKKFLERYALSKTDLILSPSKFLISELKKNYNLKSYYLPPLIEKIPSKVMDNNKKIIITFGSISPGKGSHTIEEIIHQLLSVHKNIHYYWVGNVDKKFYSSNLSFKKKLQSKTKFHNRIHIIDKLNRNKLFKLINKSEIVILPSLRDNSPNACLEALSMNKIVIARNNSGYNDLIKNKFNGFLFNKNNDFEIPLITSKILSLNNKDKKKIKKNIVFYNKEFNPKKILFFYKRYIKKII